MDFLTMSSALGVGDLLFYDDLKVELCLLSVPLLKGLNKRDTSVMTSQVFLVKGRGY